ncbi:predicted N-ribosylNicotinamide CRP-like regulator [Lachnospiraceae bacterium KM106-2]|nr:predicted N-ribosylNicotinamide CRP-like regulator [Lachnospiraceae bacterium KM106-2]
MEQQTIDRVLSLIKEAKGEEKGYLEGYLTNAPVWLLESFHIVNMEAGTVFIRENADVDFVYILIEGKVKAIDYRVFGITYDYMWWDAVKSFGAMEVILDVDKYKTTLQTVTHCKMLVISRKKFDNWMKSDINALKIESKMMVSYLLEQARRERIFLFMQGTDRVAYLLTQLYEERGNEKKCSLKWTRQELSDCTGLCVKTINRSIAKLSEDGYLSRDGNKIIITEEQYSEMKRFIAQKIDQ